MPANFRKVLEPYWLSGWRRILNAGLPCHHKLISAHFGSRPSPLGYWAMVDRMVRFLSFDQFEINTFSGRENEKGRSLKDRGLAKLLAYDELGGWRLDSRSMDIILTYLKKERPRRILECGAGISTLMLAAYAAVHDASVISMEQNRWAIDQVMERLERANLKGVVKIIHARLSKEGAYDPAKADYDLIGTQGMIDFLLIDGPFGPAGCRASTLSVFEPVIKKGARWFLDDAFRAAEVRFLVEWNRQEDTVVEGVFPVGNGLAVGRWNGAS